MFGGRLHVFMCLPLLTAAPITAVCVCVCEEVTCESSAGEASQEAGGQGVQDESALFKGPLQRANREMESLIGISVSVCLFVCV